MTDIELYNREVEERGMIDGPLSWHVWKRCLQTLRITRHEEAKKVGRVEVIDENGRAYTNYNCKDVELQFQDDGRTLKVFLKKK